MTVCYWCGAKDTLADVGKEPDDGKYKIRRVGLLEQRIGVLNLSA